MYQIDLIAHSARSINYNYQGLPIQDKNLKKNKVIDSMIKK